MPVEPQAEPQPGQPTESRAAILPAEERRSAMDLWRVLTKHRLLVLTVMMVSVAAAAWYAFRTPPVYESVSRIEIKQNALSTTVQESFWGEDDSSNLQTEEHILESDTVLFETAQALNLSTRVRPSRRLQGSGKAASPAEAALAERQALIKYIKDGLSVSIIPSTKIVEIRFRDRDPRLAAAVVNQLVDTYSDADLRTKYERTVHVSQWLGKRLEDLKQEASDAQRQLADYQRAHNIVGIGEDSNLTIQTLEHISSDLDDAEANRIIAEARVREFDSLKPDMVALMGDDPTLSALQTRLSELQTQRAQLATRYGEKHPMMQQLELQIKKLQTQINNEIERAQRQVQDEYQSAVGVEDALRQRLDTQEEAVYELSEGAAQYGILSHEAELTRDLYDTLQMRLKNASITAGLSAADITLVDPAEVPLYPVGPRKAMVLALGLVGGFLFACVLAFAIESIDDRLRTSEEVESVSMLPSLAAIPHISYATARRRGERKEKAAAAASGLEQQLITLRDPQSLGAEAYRGMRSSLLLSSIDNPPRVIIVTSAFPAEGKSTTALNLAIVLAQRGEQVLLVDADLRRGSLNRTFGLADTGFGLSTALTQPGLHKELPTPLPELPTLHVLGTGPRPPNPAEMLTSHRMEEQIRVWTQQFDRIVLDTAPLLAVSDTQAMAVRADAVVLVARAGVTRKRALVRARDLLWRINAPVAGVVVNDVDMRLENFYTYRYGTSGSGTTSDRAYGYENERGE